MAAPGEAVRTFFITLRRSPIGTPWLHKRILDALGLKRRHDCIERPNNAVIRGQLQKARTQPAARAGEGRRAPNQRSGRGRGTAQACPARSPPLRSVRPALRALLQVAHLVRIETDAMFLNRRVAEAEAASLRPPIRVAHGPARRSGGASSRGGGGTQ
jgi:ribosomal protein L30